MSYWTEFKEILARGVDIALENIKDGAGIAKEKGKEGLTYLQLKKDLMLKQRKLHDQFTDLGEVTRELYREKKDIYADERVKELMVKINNIEDECKKLEDQIKNIGKEEKKAGKAAEQKTKEEKAEDKNAGSE